MIKYFCDICEEEVKEKFQYKSDSEFEVRFGGVKVTKFVCTKCKKKLRELFGVSNESVCKPRDFICLDCSSNDIISGRAEIYMDQIGRVAKSEEGGKYIELDARVEIRVSDEEFEKLFE